MPARNKRSLEKLVDLTTLLIQEKEFQDIRKALGERQSATIDGAWGSSSALVTAAVALQCPSMVLVVLAHPGDLDEWYGDLQSFSSLRPSIFPAWDNRPGDGIDEIASQRLRLLNQLQNDPPRILITTIQALIQPVPEQSAFASQKRLLRIGESTAPDSLANWLVDHGYRNAEVVELPGEFSRRGGILDVYPVDAEAPSRLEFFGDEIESIRTFNPHTQRSLETSDQLMVTGLAGGDTPEEGPKLTGHLCDFLPADAWIVLIDVDELHEQGKHYLERVPSKVGLFGLQGVLQQLIRFPSLRVETLPSPTVEAAMHLHVESVERFSGDVNKVREELDSIAREELVLIACQNEAELRRLSEVLEKGQLAQSDRLRLGVGRVQAGFRWIPGIKRAKQTVTSEAGIVVIGGQEIFHRDSRPEGSGRAGLPRRHLESRAIDSFLDLAEGDLVVHVSHGIARYRGMQLLDHGAHKDSGSKMPTQAEEHLILEFREGVKLYVPSSKIDLVQKYIGGKSEPELSKIGSSSWAKRKQKVEEAVLDLASDMIELQAVRAAQPGVASPPDSEWQAAFEGSFPFQETPDQLTSLAEIKADMERSRPMDRLLCGDVGYGKTELAMRAAFKTIDNGRQVAVLVPTTVLAEQHARTFTQRLAEYPFVVECLSRFRTAGEQRQIIQRLHQGGIDVIIGTHRLVSADVKFRDLGLVIIDEEQRFGVEHKERLKRLRATVDVLTLTATPIPRTLHLSLLGIRDISNLETPPLERMPIETRIVRFDPQLIRHAILRELNREGQVYFVHNRVHNIQEVASKLATMVPEARLAIVHGQMSEAELEQGMLRFVQGDADILVATTIIESGLDIPNANTIFINQADTYGLADLHQLRGRVGRYRHRAYAYLLLDTEKQIQSTAAKRLKALEEFAELGAGFKIAMRDLEIRGAGNILGTQQSGHIAAVGYELYCQLLESAVRQRKQQPGRLPPEITIELPWSAYLPRDYVPGQRLRMEAYRRLSRIRKLDRLDDFEQELSDRYGSLPEPARWLIRQTRLRLLATTWRITTLHLEHPGENRIGPIDLVLTYSDQKRINKLTATSKGRLRIVDSKTAYFRLQDWELEPLQLLELLCQLLKGGDST